MPMRRLFWISDEQFPIKKRYQSIRSLVTENVKIAESIKNKASFQKFTSNVSFCNFECVKIKLKTSIEVKIRK